MVGLVVGVILMDLIDIVVVGDKDEEDVEEDVGLTVLDKLIELVKVCVEDGEGVAVIEMVYDPDGVPLAVFEEEMERLGLIVRVSEEEGDLVTVTVCEPELLEESEGEEEVEDVRVYVAEIEGECDGDDDKV